MGSNEMLDDSVLDSIKLNMSNWVDCEKEEEEILIINSEYQLWNTLLTTL